MGRSSKHIGLDCPQWRVRGWTAWITECLRSGGGSPKFHVAGRQLGVSSSAIGKAVARMEERLRVRLLHRSTRSITLTAEAPYSSNTAGASFQKSKRPRLNYLRRTRPRAAH